MPPPQATESTICAETPGDAQPVGQRRAMTLTSLERGTLRLARPDRVSITWVAARCRRRRGPAEGTRSVMWAALLPDDGPTGGFFRDGRPVDW